jgi:hypothetical protein
MIQYVGESVDACVRLYKRRKALGRVDAWGGSLRGIENSPLVERGSFSASVMDSVIEAVLLIRTL